jgi:phosphomannomutase
MTLKISISGVRGFVPESLTPEVCLDFAKAFGTYLGTKKKVVVGTDSRASSEIIKGIVLAGLLSTGCEVIDIGIAPTPTIGVMVRQLKAAGGVIITASHNPLPWNGLKFVRDDGIFLNEAEAKKLIAIYEAKTFHTAPGGTVATNLSAIDIHLHKVLQALKPQKMHYKVALDCCNGAGSVACVKLLKKLGCLVVAINCDLTKPFPHDPEPVPKNLTELGELVRKTNAAIGFAMDSDADRLAIVDEHGQPIGEELTLTLAAQYLLGKKRVKGATIVTNLSTTMALDDVAKAAGAKLIRTKIGEVHVAEKIKESKALVGGEGNGGVIYPAVGFNRDTLSGITLILQLMAASKKTVAKLVAALPSYVIVKDKVACLTQSEAANFILKTKRLFPKKNLVLTEGVKAVFPDGWVHIRASNTEPIVRIIAEGKNKEVAERLIRQVL